MSDDPLFLLELDAVKETRDKLGAALERMAQLEPGSDEWLTVVADALYALGMHALMEGNL